MKFRNLSIWKIIMPILGLAIVVNIIQIVDASAGPLAATFVFVAALTAFVFHLVRKKDSGQFGDVLRGAHVKHKPVRNARKGDMSIGGVAIPRELEASHVLLTGAPGTGKSVAIEAGLDVIRARGQRAVVYDPTGEFVSHFYREGTDTILSPIDERSPAWAPWAEGTTGYDYQNIAEALIPTGGQGEQSFWSHAARAITRAALAESCTLPDLHELIFSAPLDELQEALSRQQLVGLAGPPQMLASSRGTAATYLSALQYLPQPGEGDQVFSVKAWVQSEQDNPDGWLFVTSRADAHRGVRPLISMWLGLAVMAGMSLPPNRDRRLWFVLDELPTLQQLDSLEQLLAGARKYGLAAILGVQSIAQMRDLYGRDAASALLSHPASRLILRSGDSETADWLSATVGDRHTLRKTKSSNRGGDSESEQHSIERAVLPSEILALPSLTGFLRVPGLDAVQKIHLRPTDRREIAPPYKNRALPAVQPSSPGPTGPDTTTAWASARRPVSNGRGV